ncbi:MAG: zinc-ribbon domain-containing protein [Sandaracinaceae bacterium]|nr:zinc-ribbon domain-containing protein [Sandaracinaceae bacterium]
MKLTCESCQAKYAIADEKVAGRNFKIRCKRCGAPLVVRGEAVVASAKRERADAEWYVAAGDRQDGPFDAAQIAEQLASGAIDRETYVWKDGLPDWQPIGEVAELASSIAERAPDLFSPEPSASAFAPSPEPSLTGTRNESSVLFSLSNLKALSTAAPSQPAAREPSAPAASGVRDGAPRATGDGSGLIDIRALAAATAAPASAPSARPVDDLLALGPSAPLLASPLGAPVLVPAKREGASRGGSRSSWARPAWSSPRRLPSSWWCWPRRATAARAPDVPPEPVVARAAVEAAPAPESAVELPRAEAPRVEAPRVEETPPAPSSETEAAPAVAATPRAPREAERAPRRSPREAPTEERGEPGAAAAGAAGPARHRAAHR